ncbi:type I polyketide synthase, partial [Rugosimonospora acidiphila]|uniref:type I polyketide synthase n=1 Tax=Rugosimonospora acidiphila TaxID=556531 RepID=UPI0031EBC763
QQTSGVIDAWRYTITWKPLPAPQPATLAGHWLILTPPDAPQDDIAGLLAEHGANVRIVEVTSPDRADLAEALSAGPVDAVVSLLGLDDRPDPADPVRSLGMTATLALAQALIDLDLSVPLWLVTQGAVTIGADDAVRAPAQAQIWGFGRVFSLEEPQRWGGLVDLPAEPDDRTGQLLVAAFSGATGEDQVALRPAGSFARRMVRAPFDRAAEGRWQPRDTVLITGGTGALGGHVARWLATAGAEHLVLVSRRGTDAPGAADLTAELTAAGARVTVAACDTADPEAVHALVRDLREQGERISAAFHAAGVPQATPIADTTAAEFADVVRAKVAGAQALDQALGDDLDAFVLFSSNAGVWGSGGQGAYAAGNAHLDALAAARRARGATATSVAWGFWGGGGMASEVDLEEQLRRRGMREMQPELAVAALRQAVDADETFLAVADVDWARFVPTYTIARRRPLIEDIPEVGEATAQPQPQQAGVSALGERLAGMSEPDAVRFVLDLVRTQAAAVLGHASTDQIVGDRAFRELGFDSLTAVEVRGRLAAATGLRLPASLVFDYPTPQALAEHLYHQLAGTTATTAVRVAVAANGEPLAIVAMGCRYPGGVESPDDLWRLVEAGADVVSDLPDDRGPDWHERYDPDPERQGTFYASAGGFLDDAGAFDAEFFGISPREALAMDPQQRLLLETSWETLERAGIDPKSLRGSATGVFIGASPSGYGEAFATSEGYQLTGEAPSVMSGRLSYLFGFEGPAVTVDTACSSSLVALHLAGQSLRAGECDQALVGGAAVMVKPTAFVEFSRQGGLAADGRCKSFAEAADGTGWGEGVGMLLLERLSDARRLGHRVLAVVRGSAVNQDGASNGLTAPNGPSQQRVIRAALANAGLTPAEVDVVEAHGTGTKLGDPIEAQALLATYGQDRPEDRPLWLGSIKSNIGHTQAAAGVAGVIKMVMAMRAGVLPRTLHVDAPSSHVDWTEGAVRLLTEQREWVGDGPRRAGVSAFGVSGTNAHVVLEQPPVAIPQEESVPGPVAQDASASAAQGASVSVPWVLSGRSRGAVADLAGRLLPLVDGGDSVAAGLLGRGLWECRSVVLPSGLGAGLAALAEGRESPFVVSGEAGSDGRLGVVFTGQGAQRVGMGAGLAQVFPVFAGALDEVCGLFGSGLRPVIESGVGLERTGWAQPALFAVEVALWRLLESFGVRPQVVAGHSIGEVVAAHVAGVLSLGDAVRLVAARASLMEALPEGGAMVAVNVSEDAALAVLPGGVAA